MNSKIKTRSVDEKGFTLIELLVVIIIIGLLVAIAVPAYLSFTKNANQAAAEANVRSAIPPAEAYFRNNNNSYSGMTTSSATAPLGLVQLSPGVDPALTVSVNAGANAGDSYCLQDAKASQNYYYIGGQDASRMTDPGAGKVTAGTCPTLN